MAEKPNYKIKKRIGSGGMSTVYLAHDNRLEREVAVKVLRLDPRLGLSEAGRKEIILRFQQEAKAAARLNHPNIVSIHHVGRQGDQYYIVMEYLDGSSLGDLIKSEERPSIETILKWTDQICSGLHFAHEHGVIHRDIKPDNLILLQNGTVKITDFGIARLDHSELVKTKDQTFMGTIYYCSPEQLREFKSIDRRTDVYSMGVVFYQLLTGKLPFHERSIAETIDRIIHEDPVPPSDANPDVPEPVERVVLRCLAKDPADRYETAEALRASLQRAQAQERKPTFERRRSRAAPGAKGQMPLFLRLSRTVGVILVIATLLFGYFMIESKRNILQKDAAIRGRHMAHMLSMLVDDATIRENEELLGRYIEEMGQDAHLVFIEMMRGSQVLAGYHDTQVTAEEDVLMMSYPLTVNGPEGENLKIGFSKAAMNRDVRRIKRAIGLILAILVAGLVVVYLTFRFGRPKRAWTAR
jgi:tRNA A-37 threonylcarbamoyl transferase component Bud32